MSILELKKAASEKAGITNRAIAYRAKKIKEDYGPFSDLVAYGIVAQQVGIDVSKHIAEAETLEQIRSQIDRITELQATDSRPKTKTIVKTKTVKIGTDLNLSDPILGKNILNDAKAMTAVYAELYVLENSVRDVINRVLSKKLGREWWSEDNVNKDLRDKVQGRIDKEDKNPWHGKRGAHPIYYTDISDLIYILRRHWEHFKDIFPRLEWVSEKLEQISISRNVVDHHNPLSKRDRDRLRMNFEDWQNQINANKAKIT